MNQLQYVAFNSLPQHEWQLKMTKMEICTLPFFPATLFSYCDTVLFLPSILALLFNSSSTSAYVLKLHSANTLELRLLIDFGPSTMSPDSGIVSSADCGIIITALGWVEVGDVFKGKEKASFPPSVEKEIKADMQMM